eukprot:g971.t1
MRYSTKYRQGYSSFMANKKWHDNVHHCSQRYFLTTNSSTDSSRNEPLVDEETPTIFALSTGTNSKSAVAVFRISGPAASKALLSLTKKPHLPKPRTAHLTNLYRPLDGSLLDRSLVLFFPGPHSFTGEDVVELHVHGGTAVLKAIAQTLGELTSLNNNNNDQEEEDSSETTTEPRETTTDPRDNGNDDDLMMSPQTSSSMPLLSSSLRLLHPAAPGEFTRRAFANGKLSSLLEVEGLADLVNADTEAQRRQALAQVSPKASDCILQWRKDILKAMAFVEATIDFSDDEEDVTENAVLQAREILQKIERTILFELGGSIVNNPKEDESSIMSNNIESVLPFRSRGELIRDGISVVILGPPNAGKSSLLNNLTRKPTAIVSPEAGTTRDVVTVSLDIDGHCVHLSDTAGIRRREQDIFVSDIEQEGIRRALELADSADIVVNMHDFADHVSKTDPENIENKNKATDLMASSGAATDLRTGRGTSARELSVLNKVDMWSDASDLKSQSEADGYQLISCKTGEGIDAFMERLSKEVSTILQENEDSRGVIETPIMSRERHRVILSEVLYKIQEFHRLTTPDTDKTGVSFGHLEIAVEELREAGESIGKLAGRLDTEDVLDIIFKEFCIGK